MGFLKRFFRTAGSTPSSLPTHPPELASPITQRRYREDVPYLLPKDLGEGDRLNFQHYALRQALQGNFVVPLEKKHVEHILDVGSGTGIWGQEMARQFPRAQVVGLDLEPPQTVSLAATATPPPPNYRFQQGDVLKGLPFQVPTFDFTHQRLLVFAIPAQQWPSVMSELVRVTRSGGWIELLELEGFYSMGPFMTQADSWLQQSLKRRGIELGIISTLDTILQQRAHVAGVQLTHVHKQWLDLPIGTWKPHDRIGPLVEKNIRSVFEALQPTICAHLQIDPNSYEHLLHQLPHEWTNASTYLRCCLVSARVLRTTP